MEGLELKVARARRALLEVAHTWKPQDVAVAWTGGKDSTVALSLWQRVLDEAHPGMRAKALSLDTGCKFPEVVAFRDRMAQEWSIDLTVVRPDVGPDYPVAVDRVACCRDLKVEPLLRALKEREIAVLLTGVRADENPERASRPQTETFDAPSHVRVHPVLEFSEMDIWAYTMAQGLPYCTLYAQGYRSLGCVPCTSLVVGGDERAGRDATKEASMDALHALGYF